MEPPRSVPTARRYIAVVAALLGVVGIGVLASTVHVDLRPAAPGTSTPRQAPPPSLTAPTPMGRDALPTVAPGPVPTSVRVIGIVLLILAGAAVATLLLLLGRRIAKAHRARLPKTDPPDASVLDTAAAAGPDPVATAVAQGLDDLADDRDPRGAVIAAWVRLEEVADRAGVERAPGDTATDLVGRLLTARQVPPDVLKRFADVYLSARFSRRAVDASMRADALDALANVEQGLRGGPVEVR